MTKNYRNVDLNTANYEKMTDREAGFNTEGRNASCGIACHQVSITEVVANKNGVELRKITVTTKVHFEIYMDGSFLYRYQSEKTAKSMWKDFAG